MAGRWSAKRSSWLFGFTEGNGRWHGDHLETWWLYGRWIFSRALRRFLRRSTKCLSHLSWRTPHMLSPVGRTPACLGYGYLYLFSLFIFIYIYIIYLLCFIMLNYFGYFPWELGRWRCHEFAINEAMSSHVDGINDRLNDPGCCFDTFRVAMWMGTSA
jgi:hypothetical protein